MPAQSRIDELERLIARHQDLYYNGQPELSDAEFDELWDELTSLDPGNRILKKVGSDTSDGWPKARHVIPMGSQSKASSPEEFLAWARKTGFPEYIVQFKLDGASLELQYESGVLKRAVTRGDGQTGDDITPNVRRMSGVPHRLAESFTGGVRGEVLLTHALHVSKYSDKANCRNAANGLMKRKDGMGSEDLVVICYDAMPTPLSERKEKTKAENEPESGDDSGDPADGPRRAFADEREKGRWLVDMGFTVVPSVTLTNADDIVTYRAQIMDRRPSLEYDIDGLVVREAGIDLEDAARARPEKQIAFKFSPEEAISTIRSIEWSESGATFTPIGIVDPVRLAGTIVKRANLCNTNIMKSLKIMIGSRIVVTKRGEIIPKIESLVENPPDCEPIPIPERCSCGAILVDEGTRLYCPDMSCPKKSLHRLEKWVSVLGIMDFGGAILARLHESGRVSIIADLYTLTVPELCLHERMGEVLATKILRNLSAKKEIALAEFVAGLDIEGIGELLVERAIAAGFDTLEKLKAAKVGDLSGVFGIADKTAETIVGGLSDLAHEIDALLGNGHIHVLDGKTAGPLASKYFCFTGELSSLNRVEAEALVKSLGGGVKTSVTKDLDYLVTNDPDSGSSKNRKARALGIGILDEKSFLALVGRG
jgi:DNA ligase (NAD+)